jgi:hypothetical protein
VSSSTFVERPSSGERIDAAWSKADNRSEVLRRDATLVVPDRAQAMVRFAAALASGD